jgi:hypothetical protein
MLARNVSISQEGTCLSLERWTRFMQGLEAHLEGPASGDGEPRAVHFVVLPRGGQREIRVRFVRGGGERRVRFVRGGREGRVRFARGRGCIAGTGGSGGERKMRFMTTLHDNAS